MDLTKIKKIYMIGIKGVGMTMLAQYFAVQGIEVVGSDTKDKFMTDVVLKNAGIKIVEKFDVTNILPDADLIVYSTAYNVENNIEVAAALAGKIKTLMYAQALGEIFNQKYGIAVVGSHGKTTVTAWLGFVLNGAGLKPNVMVGAAVPQFNGASLVGSSDYLIIEADEYQNKLRYFNPRAVILNNIDWDHPDFFPTPEEYRQVFVDFISKISGKGFLVANFDDSAIRSLANVNCRGRVISYAIKEAADYMAYDIKYHDGKQYFKVKLGVDDDIDEEETVAASTLGDFAIQLSGQHNIYNALAVIAASIELGVELHLIRQYLEDFFGTERRAQVLGEFRGATIIDDYAHHPTEIKSTLAGLRQKYGQRKIVLVFHPHTFTRTKALLDDFSTSFADADELILLDIYGSAREQTGGVSINDLIVKIKAAGNLKSEPKHIPTLIAVETYLRGHLERGDVLVLMGAGDVFKIGAKLIND